MGLLEAALVLIALLALIGGIVRWHLRQLNEPEAEPDLAAPYREGLEAATRIQAATLALEQQIYAEAMRHAEGDQAGKSRKAVNGQTADLRGKD